MGTDFKILLVDDDVVSRRVVQKYLQKAGYSVVTAADGQNALDLLDRQFFPIVLTDWMMPGIDGPQLCRLIRKKKTDGYVYIILITARDSKTDIVSGLDSGADDYLTKPIYPAEMLARIHTGLRILKLEGVLKKANEEIRLLSITDPLTGCFNRGYLNDRLCYEITRAQRCNRPLSVVLTDIDHFKKVNDTYGHQVGDEVLKVFARCIQQEIRKNIDWVVRYGGEEFLVVLPETNNPGTFSLAERLRASVAEKGIKVANDELRITASFGGVCATVKNKNDNKMVLERLISLADEQLYRSKNSGRNCTHVADFDEGK